MKQPNIILLFFWLLIFSPMACTDGTEMPEEPTASPKDYHSGVTSLYSVIAHPERYSGKHVILFGYYHKGIADEAAFLFISQDHAMHRDYTSSVMVENVDKKGQTPFNLCGGQYVRVSGTLHLVEGISGMMETVLIIAAPQTIRISRTDNTGPRCWPPHSGSRYH